MYMTPHTTKRPAANDELRRREPKRIQKKKVKRIVPGEQLGPLTITVAMSSRKPTIKVSERRQAHKTQFRILFFNHFHS